MDNNNHYDDSKEEREFKEEYLDLMRRIGEYERVLARLRAQEHRDEEAIRAHEMRLAQRRQEVVMLNNDYHQGKRKKRSYKKKSKSRKSSGRKKC